MPVYTPLQSELDCKPTPQVTAEMSTGQPRLGRVNAKRECMYRKIRCRRYTQRLPSKNNLCCKAVPKLTSIAGCFAVAEASTAIPCQNLHPLTSKWVRPATGRKRHGFASLDQRHFKHEPSGLASTDQQATSIPPLLYIAQTQLQLRLLHVSTVPWHGTCHTCKVQEASARLMHGPGSCGG
jgi:hypothetical protein